MKVYVATLRPKSKTVAWTQYQGWNFQAGCVSAEGRVFFGNDTRIFRHGSRFEPILSDYEGYATYDGGASNRNSVSVYGTYCDSATLGTGIQFYHEMPNNALVIGPSGRTYTTSRWIHRVRRTSCCPTS
jgi:hypothetical protein